MTPLDFKLIGNRAMQEGTFESEETQLINQLIPNVDVFINVGANIGYYSCIALAHERYVVAFEPVNPNLHYLLKNIRANNKESQIEVFPVALSNKVGTIEIYGGGTGASLIRVWAGAPEQQVTLVPSSTLDNVLGLRFQGKKCFVLVDIEGAELLMLQGSRSFLCRKPKPIWMMEVCISEHQPKGVETNPNLLATFEMFWNSGYESWTADNRRRLVQRDEIENVVKSGKDTLHTHNFLFIERGKKNELMDA